jgi:hypothetical protein
MAQNRIYPHGWNRFIKGSGAVQETPDGLAWRRSMPSAANIPTPRLMITTSSPAAIFCGSPPCD